MIQVNFSVSFFLMTDKIFRDYTRKNQQVKVIERHVMTYSHENRHKDFDVGQLEQEER